MFVRSCVATMLAIAVLLAPTLRASGPLGVYAIVEKVVFEPTEAGATRLQVWGAFALFETTNGSVTRAARGYMFLFLPTQPSPRTPNELDMVRREWSDLKAVAGTGQTVGFGEWRYMGRFDALDPSERRAAGYVPEGSPSGQAGAFRVRPAAEVPDHPMVYRTNAGIVKLADSGSQRRHRSSSSRGAQK